VFGAECPDGNDTTIPVLAKGKTITDRSWSYVREDAVLHRVGPVGYGIHHWKPNEAVFAIGRDRRAPARGMPSRSQACHTTRRRARRIDEH
jgi:hypothetical protein